MKQFQTKYFGEVSVEEDRVIHFNEGLPGFESQKDFVILNNHDTEDPVPFMWLQSMTDPDLAFVVSIPFFLRPDYEFEIPTEICNTLELTSADEAGIYTICHIGGSVDSMTFNLRSPIVINANNRKAVQLILSDTRYTTREMMKNIL